MDQGIVSPLAFKLEDKDRDNALSVNWLEILRCPDRSTEIAEVQHVLSRTMLRVSKNSRIAVLNVGQSLTAVNELNEKLSVTVLHNPVEVEGKEDPSHSGIYGLPRIEPDLATATALRDSIIEVHPAIP